MTAQPAYAPISIGRDEYRIPGLSVERLRRALSLLVAADQLQGDVADGRREQLLQTLIVADFDPIPAATLEQAKRAARHRQRLLASGAYTIEALGALRGDATQSATRTWLTRRRRAHELFTVTHQNATLVPAFQLGEQAEPMPGLPRVLDPLQRSARLGGWQTWTWLTVPSPWLGGDIPIEQLGADPGRVAGAAARFASNFG